MEKKLKMVVGFMFNEAETGVLLILKQKPAWQKNKLNGIGGKVEPGETFHSAMCREFEEETGIEHLAWNEVIMMSGDDWAVQVFTASSDSVFHYKQMEEEKLSYLLLRHLSLYNKVSNLNWLIPMCLDKNDGKGTIDYSIHNLLNSEQNPEECDAIGMPND